MHMMTTPTVEQLKRWFSNPRPGADLAAQIRAAAATPQLRAMMAAVAPDVRAVPMLTYSLYRQFEHTGEHPAFQDNYFARRTILTRALVEAIMRDESMISAVEDLLWAVCEETSWLM